MHVPTIVWLATVFISVATADGNVGCLFSESLCVEKVEWCYDDNAFGRCLQVYGNVEEDELYQYELDREQLHTLEREMQRLFALGYRWSHPYTQCELQALLYAHRNGLELDNSMCNHLSDQDLEAALKAFEGDEQVDGQSVAYVKYKPSDNNPHADFADEIYYPPASISDDLANQVLLRDLLEQNLVQIPSDVVADGVLSPNNFDVIDVEDPTAYIDSQVISKRSFGLPLAIHKRSSVFSRHYNTPEDFRSGQESRDVLEFLRPLDETTPNFISDAIGLSNIDQLSKYRDDRPSFELMPDDSNVDFQYSDFRGRLPYDLKDINQPEPRVIFENISPNNIRDSYRQSVNLPHFSNPRSHPSLESDYVVMDPRSIRSLSDEQSEQPPVDISVMKDFIRFTVEPENDSGLTENDYLEFLPIVEYLQKLQLKPEDVDYLLKPENVDLLRKILPETYENDEETNEIPSPQNYNTPNSENLLDEWLQSDDAQRLNNKLEQIRSYNTINRIITHNPEILDNDDAENNDISEQRIYYEDDEDDLKENNEVGSGYRREHESPEIFRELENDRKQHALKNDEKNLNQMKLMLSEKYPDQKTRVYTEGGIVFVPEPRISGVSDKTEPAGDISDLLSDYEWGFKRRERLDVKKPGPPFDSKSHMKSDASATGDASANLAAPRKSKKELKNDGVTPTSHEQYDVDTSYTYVKFKNRISTWNDGIKIVNTLAKLLGLDNETFTYPRVHPNEVTFKVEPNSKQLNASDLPLMINAVKDKLKEETGLEVVSAGIGDKTKLAVVSSTLTEETSNTGQMFVTKLLIGCVLAALSMAIVTLLLIKRHATSRQKLHEMAAPDTEASKDYQELCRSRMASKGQSGGNGGDKSEAGIHGRITSLSRESEGSQQSPSSRSSTSSWSEEPALSNMDISTGHMVLTYMEDHLKNKDRLDQEWIALCAYEAEPCATTIALKPENVEKNRYMEVLPYDHSRVVLNDLANESGSDYINASTITDHDPRNPAYIATQGPLPHTAPDFWQMVWEQGSVVMVMLSRLTENGSAMCHRYWPEEGSELYHIYEVHLVSEHIWCDDYLVRSFYLKNVKTGETRTVTQFHFLSWPDHGIPTSTKALLEFRRKVNKSYRGRSCPIVVHCSDGAGRTGTYCLIDMVLNRMAKGAKEIDIAATLEHIRDQRPAMVATKQQFEFVLMAVAEEVHAILKALPAQLQQQQDKKEQPEKDKQDK